MAVISGSSIAIADLALRSAALAAMRAVSSDRRRKYPCPADTRTSNRVKAANTKVYRPTESVGTKIEAAYYPVQLPSPRLRSVAAGDLLRFARAEFDRMQQMIPRQQSRTPLQKPPRSEDIGSALLESPSQTSSLTIIVPEPLLCNVKMQASPVCDSERGSRD
jgi:hypothetical protein